MELNTSLKHLEILLISIFALPVLGNVQYDDLEPSTTNTYSLGTSTYQWKDAYGDGTLDWDTLTDGTFIITGGAVTAGAWHGTAIDISSYTNLVAGTNITLSGDTLNVDDAFLVNDGDDTTTGVLTASNFISDVAIGTSPYACTSTTLNANLNADLWDGYEFADYLDQAVKTISCPTFERLTLDFEGTRSNLTHRITGNIGMSVYRFQRARNTQASPEIVQDDDYLGRFDFEGYDGNTYQTAAQIDCWADGTPSADSMPGRLSFYTTPDGSVTSVERLEIDNAGDFDFQAGDLTTTGTIQAEQLTSTDDITMQGHLLSLGDVGAATDTVVNFLGSTNSGSITYDESADKFNFGLSDVTANVFYVGGFLYHKDDTDTGIYFGTDNFSFVAGNFNLLKMSGAGGKIPVGIIVNENAVDVDFRIETVNNDRIFKTDAGNDKIFIGDGGTTNYTEYSTTGDLSLFGSAILSWSNQPSKPKIYSQASEPNIPNDTYAFWTDTDDGKYYLILDIAGVQKKVELI